MKRRHVSVPVLVILATLVQWKHTSTSEQIRDTLRQGSYALISAGSRPDDIGGKSKEQQEQLSRCLEQDLRALGFTIYPAQGRYEGHSETSFFVHTTRDAQPTLIYLGERYGQDAVVVGNEGVHALVYMPRERNTEKEGGEEKKKVEQEKKERAVLCRGEPHFGVDGGKNHTAIQLSDHEAPLRFELPCSNDNKKKEPYPDAEKAFDRSFDPLTKIQRTLECAAMVKPRSEQSPSQLSKQGL